MKTIPVIVERMPGKIFRGNTAIRAFRRGHPKTWEASDTEEGALGKLANTLGCEFSQLNVVKRGSNEATRRMAAWEDFGTRLKDTFGLAPGSAPR